MKNIQKNILWLEVSHDAQRQFIDARAAFQAWEECLRDAGQVRGGMHWKVQVPYEYLIRTSVGNAQKSLGPRSPETEQIHEAFTARKRAVEQRLASLAAALERHQRLNRALQVGRAPVILVRLLARLAKAGLAEHFVVIGTHALYAYETAAGILITPEALATRDIDLLWDTRKRLSLMTTLKRLDIHFLGLLRKVDPTFALSAGDKAKAVNSDGFEVDVLRREAREGDPNPLRVTDHDEDIYAVQARRAGVLLSGPRFSQVVVAANGQMARMNTVSPAMFAKFKRWMSVQGDRDPLKRSRDAFQGEIVERLLAERLPHLSDTGDAGVIFR